MNRTKLMIVVAIAVVFAAGVFAGRISHAVPVSLAASSSADSGIKGRVFEIRTYTTQDGQLDALSARFRDHTMSLLERHGITNIGYWIPQDPPLSRNTLIFILAHPSREAAKKNWEEFGNDPDFQKLRAEAQAYGPVKVQSVFADATDYSPLK